MREHFHFFSHGLTYATSIKNPYVILDTNVLNAVSSMALKGYDPQNVQHRRVANLFRWLIRYDVEYARIDFALVEGSGFHSGTINDYALLQRYIPFEALRLLDLNQIENFVNSRTAGKFQAQAEAMSENLQGTLEAAQESIVEIFGPNYVASLAIHEGIKSGLKNDQLFEFVVNILEEKLDFIPAIALLAATLISYGTPDVRRRLLQELFKTNGVQARTSILSAAWDLSYLQALTILDVQIRDESFPAEAAILITDDSALGFLASTLKSEGFLFMEPPLSFLDPRKVSRFRQLSQELQVRRQATIPRKLSRQHVQSVCAPLENLLGISHLELQITNPSTVVSIDIPLLRAVANVARWERQDLLDALTEIPPRGDQLSHVLFLIRQAILDNSDKQGRGPRDSVIAISEKMREEFGFTGLPTIGERLVWAFMRQDRIEFNALLYQVNVVEAEMYGDALLHACSFLRSTWLDTGSVLGKSIEEIIDIIIPRLTKENLENP